MSNIEQESFLQHRRQQATNTVNATGCFSVKKIVLGLSDRALTVTMISYRTDFLFIQFKV